MGYLVQIQYRERPTSVVRYEHKNAAKSAYSAAAACVGSGGEVRRVALLESTLPNRILASRSAQET